MPISSAILSLLTQKYPHCTGLLDAFAPLLDARSALVDALPPPALPQRDEAAFATGAPLVPPCKEHLSSYLDAPLLEAAPHAIVRAASKGFPLLAEDFARLETLLKENKSACRALAAYPLKNMTHRVPFWAKKHAQNPHAASILSAHMAATAARRVAVAAANTPLPAWEKSHCPVCGSTPHAGYLHNTEGQRSLQCSLCGHAWRFSRTACPFCGDASPDKRQVFYTDAEPSARAEGCDVCQRYLLVPDMRASLDIPLELLLLCLMPLDLLMQEKGYLPGPHAAAS